MTYTSAVLTPTTNFIYQSVLWTWLGTSVNAQQCSHLSTTEMTSFNSPSPPLLHCVSPGQVVDQEVHATVDGQQQVAKL